MADVELDPLLEIYDTPCSGGLVKQATLSVVKDGSGGMLQL